MNSLDRLPRSEARRRASRAAPWQHALQRMQERHEAGADFWRVYGMGLQAGRVYAAKLGGMRTSEGGVRATESDGTVVIRLSQPDGPIDVVYCPETKVLRTVLPRVEAQG